MPRISREFQPKSPVIEPQRQSMLVRAALAIACAGMAQLMAGCAPKPHSPQSPLDEARSEIAETDRFPVTIRKPDRSPTIPTGTFDEKGVPITIACLTCHTTKPVNPNTRLGQPATTFHQGLSGPHGNLSCVSCHNPSDGYSSLRLADGKSVPFPEVMTLCAQCHGSQFRDYQHGAHGGMTGYWDLTKGGRARNNCIDCHAPHQPKYPTVMPSRGPHDRFQIGGDHD